MATVTVRLYRDSLQTQWGFRVQGGSDFHTPLTVQRVFTGSPAEGELHRGDIIASIDTCDTSGMQHREAQDLIRNSGGTIVLNVRRPYGGGAIRAPSVAVGGGGGPHTRGPSQPAWRPTGGGGGPRQEFGVQYGGGGQRGGGARPEAQQYHRQLPAQQQRDNTADNYMMDRVSRSLAGMDLQAAAQRSMDDQDIDYAFAQQSVADRRKAFMQPTNYGNTYHSVPRPNPAASAAAARYRQKRQPDPVLGQRFTDFGWAPSADKMRQARGGWGPSHAGQEQQSYLPSRGQGREESPFRSTGRGGGHGARAGGGGGGGRQRTSATLRLNSTGGYGGGSIGGGGGGGGGNGGVNDGPGEVPLAYNNKQYNTPINMYSKQNIANAFEGQMGIALEPGRGGNPDQQPAYNQSQVYKLVHEQDSQRRKQPPATSAAPRQAQSAGPAWVRQQSDGDDYGVSEF